MLFRFKHSCLRRWEQRAVSGLGYARSKYWFKKWVCYQVKRAPCCCSDAQIEHPKLKYEKDHIGRCWRGQKARTLEISFILETLGDGGRNNGVSIAYWLNGYQKDYRY